MSALDVGSCHRPVRIRGRVGNSRSSFGPDPLRGHAALRRARPRGPGLTFRDLEQAVEDGRISSTTAASTPAPPLPWSSPIRSNSPSPSSGPLPRGGGRRRSTPATPGPGLGWSRSARGAGSTACSLDLPTSGAGSGPNGSTAGAPLRRAVEWSDDVPGGAVLASSGTTGAPKVIPLHQGRLLHTARSVSAHHRLTPSDRGFNSLPLLPHQRRSRGPTGIAGRRIVPGPRRPFPSHALLVADGASARSHGSTPCRRSSRGSPSRSRRADPAAHPIHPLRLGALAGRRRGPLRGERPGSPSSRPMA